MSVTVEIYGLEVAGNHGAEEDERTRGQTFLFDLELDVDEAGLSDRIEDAVDYRVVTERVRAVSDGRRFHLLEALAAAVADDLAARFPLQGVQVRVRKPAVRTTGVPADWTAATVKRP